MCLQFTHKRLQELCVSVIQQLKDLYTSTIPLHGDITSMQQRHSSCRVLSETEQLTVLIVAAPSSFELPPPR